MIPGFLVYFFERLFGSWILPVCCYLWTMLKEAYTMMIIFASTCRYSDHAYSATQQANHISKKQCEWKATHEAANGPCDLCLNALVHTCTLRSTQASCQWRGLAGHHECEQGYPGNCAWVVCWFSFWQVFTSIDAAAGQ